MIRSIEELKELKGIRVLLRASLNAPIQNGAVQDATRLNSALPTIQFLTARGAKVILASHMSDSVGSLRPVFDHLGKHIALSFVDDVAGVAAHTAVNALKDGQILLLENLRRNAGEKANDMAFARELASLADIFVNDDFTVAHRKHAGVVLVPTILPSYAGFQFLKELNGLTPALNPKSPSLAILGGAKLVTKLTLLKRLLEKYDRVFVGGALANDFYAAKGYETGKSLVSGMDIAKELLGNSKIILPEEVTVFSADASHDTPADELSPNDVVSDISIASIRALKPVIDQARFVLWNGPMGHFETGFTKGTDELAKIVADAPGTSIVGGGDTLSSIQTLGVQDKFEFVSTSGGAMLDFLSSGTLPGIEALEKSASSV
jgi:phosphoglycerate kinase